MAKKKDKKIITVGFIPLGCPKNIVDSERMLAHIAQAGFIITTDPDNCDVLVVNTCGFIAPAKAEALEIINNAIDHKNSGNIKKIIVAGCLSQRMGTDLFEEVNGIDTILGTTNTDNIVNIITKTLLHHDKPLSFLDYRPAPITDDKIRFPITPTHCPYLKISQGCSHSCSFCTIPAIRGPFKSKPQKQILDEANQLVSAGAVELNLIAQDTASYGKDINEKNALCTLLGQLEKIPSLEWIRLLYMYPAGITDALIETIQKSKKIVHYLDIPIQHINDQILTLMRRPDTKEKITSLLEKLRQTIPDMILRTTLIVGFPSETDEQFNELLDFVKQVKFDALGCFAYSPEPGTDAAEMPNQIPDDIKHDRLEELMLTQQQIAFEKNKQRIGTELLCLVDSVDKNKTAQARFYGQAPDIDSICIIKNTAAQPAQLIKTKVTKTKNYDLITTPITNNH